MAGDQSVAEIVAAATDAVASMRRAQTLLARAPSRAGPEQLNRGKESRLAELQAQRQAALVQAEAASTSRYSKTSRCWTSCATGLNMSADSFSATAGPIAPSTACWCWCPRLPGCERRRKRGNWATWCSGFTNGPRRPSDGMPFGFPHHRSAEITGLSRIPRGCDRPGNAKSLGQPSRSFPTWIHGKSRAVRGRHFLVLSKPIVRIAAAQVPPGAKPGRSRDVPELRCEEFPALPVLGLPASGAKRLARLTQRCSNPPTASRPWSRVAFSPPPEKTPPPSRPSFRASGAPSFRTRISSPGPRKPSRKNEAFSE